MSSSLFDLTYNLDLEIKFYITAWAISPCGKYQEVVQAWPASVMTLKFLKKYFDPQKIKKTSEREKQGWWHKADWCFKLDWCYFKLVRWCLGRTGGVYRDSVTRLYLVKKFYLELFIKFVCGQGAVDFLNMKSA